MTLTTRTALLTAACLLVAGPVQAPLTVTESGKTVTVTCTQGLTWTATVDGTHGGAVREFRLPADGPNLVAAENGPFAPGRGVARIILLHPPLPTAFIVRIVSIMHIVFIVRHGTAGSRRVSDLFPDPPQGAGLSA
jgi:hypothetical protein